MFIPIMILDLVFIVLGWNILFTLKKPWPDVFKLLAAILMVVLVFMTACPNEVA